MSKDVRLLAALAWLNKEKGLEETPESIQSWKEYPGVVAVVISDFRKFTIPIPRSWPPEPENTQAIPPGPPDAGGRARGQRASKTAGLMSPSAGVKTKHSAKGAKG